MAFDLQTETQEGWGVTEAQTLPIIHRVAKALKRAKHRFFDRVFYVLFKDLKLVYDGIVNRVMWQSIPVEEWFHEEEGTERPAIKSELNGFRGYLFRKTASKKEYIIVPAKALLETGAIRLLVTSEHVGTGGVVFSVTVMKGLDDPAPNSYTLSPALAYDNTAAQPQLAELSTETLTVGDNYYYKIMREKDAAGDTLDADVLLTDAQPR